MKMEQILKGLSDEQRKQEKKLRAGVYRELENYSASRRELGRLLLELHDEVVGAKRFKEYVELLGIARRSAYRWMGSYKAQANLPATVLRAADNRKLDLGSAKYQEVLAEIPLTENPSPTEAEEWLDKVAARKKRSRGNLPKSGDPKTVTPEERSNLTSKEYVRHLREMGSFAAAYWREVPAAERSIEVAKCLMGAAAAQIGITETFTVVPDPNPKKSDRLVKRLIARAARRPEIEVPVAA